MPPYSPLHSSDTVQYTHQRQGTSQLQSAIQSSTLPWTTFEDMLHRLHADGVYVHSEQLAEFLLAHGLPVDLRYVPSHLQSKARHINEHYQGDMAALADEPSQPF
ncbi:MAG TPA: hypothetical protein ACFE0H_03320 [Elainellaceae cyanobacterium]